MNFMTCFKVVHQGMFEKNLPPASSLHVLSFTIFFYIASPSRELNCIYGVCLLSLKINETAGEFLFDKSWLLLCCAPIFKSSVFFLYRREGCRCLSSLVPQGLVIIKSRKQSVSSARETSEGLSGFGQDLMYIFRCTFFFQFV